MLVGFVTVTAIVGLTTATAAFDTSTPDVLTKVGKGTTRVSGKLLDLTIGGGLLHLAMFTDTGLVNIDPASGPSSAKNSLVPLTLSSSVLPLSTLTGLLPLAKPQSVLSPGGIPSVNLSSLDLSSTPLGALISGTLNTGKLSSALDPVKGATSSLTASLSHLKVLGGLVTIDTMLDQDALQAAPSAATASRTFDVAHVGLLSLGGLLQGLGIDPARLPLSTVTNLLSQLNLPGLPVGGLLSGLTSTLTTTLSGLLGPVMNLLDTPLLEVDTGPLSVTTTSASSLAKSAAVVKATQPSLKVAGKTLPGLDLTSLVQTVTSTLSSLLGAINPGLANVITVAPLTTSHSVTRSHGYIDAVAQASELTITIDPSKALGGIGKAAESLPAAGDSAALGSILGDITGPLAGATGGIGSAPLALGPTTLTLGAVTSESKFTA
jgi:hypothetical protein